MSNPTRPALRYHGGKWLLAPWIISHFPKHRIYVEPFGGAMSVLLRKKPAYAEIYNDLDDDVVNLFSVLRSPDAEKLLQMLRLTPFSRAEFQSSYSHVQDPIERARHLIIRSYMGFGSDGYNAERRTGFRSNSSRSGTTPAHDWKNYPNALMQVITRLSGVTIENRDALKVMEQHDSPETLHYIDPPYLHQTRSQKKRRSGEVYHAYAHELSDLQHDELLTYIQNLQGMVVLSGYPSDKYDQALAGWQRIERKALADGARERTECIWVNASASNHLDHGPLFAVANQ